MTPRPVPLKAENVKDENKIIGDSRIVRRSPRHLPENLKKELLEKETIIEKDPDISTLKSITFTGRLYYCTDFEGCATICDQVIQRIEKHPNEIVPIGFDLEWPFSFQTGSGKTALAQLCVSENTCHLFHIHKLDKLPKALVLLLSHPRVKLVGVNVKNDVWKLGRDFKEFPAEKVVLNNCIDCGPLTNKVYKRSVRWSLQKLTAYILKKKISKDVKVRNSKWHILPLSEEQKTYAATDAYVSLLLYLTIQKKAKELEAKEEEKNSTELEKQISRLGYRAGLHLQQTFAKQHQNENLPADYPRNTLILIEHNPVYTVGIRNKGYTDNDIKELTDLGAEFHKTNRGGLITFHGPGQLVAYPIIDLRQFQPSMRWYVSQIERMIIRLCAEFGIKAATSPDTGVWVEDRKICAIGIHGSRYITTHGLALNCNTDLKWFDHIVPCGIEGKSVTSISKELKLNIKIDDVVPLLKHAFKEEFQCSIVDLTPVEASVFLRASYSASK